jgi:hypothetical protein
VICANRATPPGLKSTGIADKILNHQQIKRAVEIQAAALSIRESKHGLKAGHGVSRLTSRREQTGIGFTESG